MSVAEASNTMKQGIFTGSRGASGSLGVPANSGAIGTTSASGSSEALNTPIAVG